MKDRLLKEILEPIYKNSKQLELKVVKPDHKDPTTLCRIEISVPLPRMKMVNDKTLHIQLKTPRMTHPQKVLAILRALYIDLTDGQEYAHVITLDTKLRFINAWQVGQGGSDHVMINRAQVFKRILADDDASAFIIAHNHPSGDPAPSEDDYAMLEDLKRGALYLDRPMKDFIILADGTDKYYSHKDNNYEL